MYGYGYMYIYGVAINQITSWTTIIFSDGNDLVFSDGNNLGYGV